MDRDALRRRLLGTFLGELEEHVRTLEHDLLTLEHGAGAAAPDIAMSIYRSVHSLKGAARAVSLEPIEAVCHRLEALLRRGRGRGRPHAPEAAAAQLLFAAVDALRDAGDRLRRGVDLAGGPLQALLPRIAAAARERDTVEPADGGGAATADPDAPPPAPPPDRLERVVRLPLRKLDELLASTGELQVARRRAAADLERLAALRDDVHRCSAEWRWLEGPLRKLAVGREVKLQRRAVLALQRVRDGVRTIEHRLDAVALRTSFNLHALERAAGTVEEHVRQARMFPFSQACEGLERALRDLAQSAGKQAALVIDGGEIELGRLVLEGLRDPLLHLVRNAVDHGIESPADRAAAGKPSCGTITITATLPSSTARISIADDGRGLDVEALRAAARGHQLAAPETDRDAARLAFHPGLSTAQSVTELSGRGMGLDIVRHRIESLHGHVTLETAAGRGTRVILTVPVRVATMRVLLVEVAAQVYAVPVGSVQRLLRVRPADLRQVAGRAVLPTESAPVPVAALGDVLGVQPARRREAPARVPLVVLESGDARAAVSVDALLDEEEVLMKGLGARLRRVRHVAAATILPSGRVALVLHVPDVVQSAITRATPARAPVPAEPPARPRPRLLVVDDSVTTRTLERSLLEAAGYEVAVAADGSEAWRLLQHRGADLVVADVEMPRMDGFALCEAIRRSPRFRALPVVLVTALASDADRQRGLDAGADAYLVKSSFDQRQLLDTVARLL